MSIDWTHFTPWASLVGGLLLGVAVTAFILINGRILGISGIIGGLLPLKSADIAWRFSFLLGLAAAPWLWAALAPVALQVTPRIDTSWSVVVVAGLLVGLGTRMGSGCTSGHGVCGLSRLSFRSFAATLTFMAFGFLTVFILRHALRWI